MKKAIYVPLSSDAFEALRRLAAQELRHPRQQAARLILDGLTRSQWSPNGASAAGAEPRITAEALR